MKKDENEIVTEEGFALNFYPRETKDVSLRFSIDTIEIIEQIAAKKKTSVESVIRFFVGKGLRDELDPQQAADLMRKKLVARREKQKTPLDLAA